MNENNNTLNSNAEPTAKKKVSFVHVSSANKPEGTQPVAPQPQPEQPPRPAQPYVSPPQPQANYNPYATQQYAQYPYGQYNPYAGNPYYYGQQYQQYPYYNAQFATEQYQKQLKIEQAKKKVRFLGTMSGVAVLLFLLMNVLVSTAILIPGIKELYSTSAAFQSAFSIVSAFLYIFIPFMITYAVVKKREPDVDFFPFKKMNPKRAILSVPIGLAVCLAGNIITNLFINLLSSAGLKLSQPSDFAAKTNTVPALLLSLVATAIMPALLEEFALRGVIMQPMRKYGTAFAIICSSVIFGTMHGNLIQAPFAFIVGLGVAFFAIKCDSIWIAVIIHMLNNGYSVIMDFLGNRIAQKSLDMISYIVVGAIVLLAVICAVILLVSDKDFFKKETGNIACEDAKILGAGQKAFAFFVNAPMIVSFVLIALLTAQYVK